MKQFAVRWGASLCAAMLVACGGGGDNKDPAATPSSTGGIPASVDSAAAFAKTQGAYVGATTTTDGAHLVNQFLMLRLEDGSVWTFYGSTADNWTINGFLQGTTVFDGTTYTSPDLKNFGVVPAVQATASSTISDDGSIKGTSSMGGTTYTIQADRISADVYDYNARASASSITGSWVLTSAATHAVQTIDISATGDVTSTLDGCAFSGTVLPRASGKNVFDVTVHFGAAPCALPNQTVKGIAIYRASADGKNSQLIVAGTDASRTVGLVLNGARPGVTLADAPVTADAGASSPD